MTVIRASLLKDYAEVPAQAPHQRKRYTCHQLHRCRAVPSQQQAGADLRFSAAIQKEACSSWPCEGRAAKTTRSVRPEETKCSIVAARAAESDGAGAGMGWVQRRQRRQWVFARFCGSHERPAGAARVAAHTGGAAGRLGRVRPAAGGLLAVPQELRGGAAPTPLPPRPSSRDTRQGRATP